ncbi:hypothetical protein OE059_03185 [Exiguobacterium profundum]|uniref:DUF669 domain-containing protein n=1 Tax=Exiguobacterium profundum TaxID=307643 RepID=A0ABY8B4M3_9BACL|nr:hypothetical protein [Exiguobacterium profundum]WED55877.1 hypothetical protein OE059_03185 [Exiguobacterium profundum]
MKFSRQQQVSFKLPEEGHYGATIIDVKEVEPINNPMYGETDRVDVYFDLVGGYRLKKNMLVYAGGNSMFEKLVDSTLGDVEEIDVMELVGRTCGVEIEHNVHKGKTYANVVDVFNDAWFENYDEQDELPE